VVAVLNDPAFTQTTFVVIDFEALTPAGRPGEPIEVAAIAGNFHDGTWAESARFHSLMRPPDDVAVTRFDTAVTGLTSADLAAQQPAGPVLAALDARMTKPPYRLVAHSAHTEAGIIARHRDHCPVLAATPLLCTVRLARAIFPDLTHHTLDTLLKYLTIPRPPDRHRAMPDTELTVQVLMRCLAAGAGRTWSTLRDLDIAAGIFPKPRQTEAGKALIQEQLF
jgi:DNA polymerase-3 subunit epsilon